MSSHQSTRIVFRCPKCQKQLKTEAQFAGKQVKCPVESCATLLIVPPASSPALSDVEQVESLGKGILPKPVSYNKKKPIKGAIFKEEDYVPFVVGFFLIGGLLTFPFLYGLQLDISYLLALPWSLGSCVVFLIGFRKNGTISWLKFVPAYAVLTITAMIVNHSSGGSTFAAGGIIGFVIVILGGKIGIIVSRHFRRA